MESSILKPQGKSFHGIDICVCMPMANTLFDTRNNPVNRILAGLPLKPLTSP